MQNQTQSRAEPRSLFSPPPRPPKRFILASDLESGVDPAPTQPRVPFHPITHQVNTTATKSITSIRENLAIVTYLRQQ